MTKILVECPQKIASVRVGVLEPLRPLEENGTCQVRYRDTQQITKADICWCDILVCVRGCEYPTLRIVRAAKSAGRFLVYFLDDDLLHIPDGNTSTRYYCDNKIKVNLTQIMGLCDVLWAVNQQIINQYGHFVSRSILLRVPAEVLRQPPAPSEPIHVLYAGSADHSKIVQEFLVPAIQRILKEFLGKVDFTFIGADPGLRHTFGVIYYPYFESYEEYRKVVFSGNFSIGLAPVYNTPFYACKYYNKFVEYSSLGIAGIYSAYEPYQQVVVSGQNGILCENTEEAWYQAIKSLLVSQKSVEKIALNAAVLLKKCFRYESVAQSLVQQMPEIISFQATSLSEADISLPPMKILFYQERFLLLFRIYGPLAIFVIPFKALKKIVKFIWKKLRKK